MNSERCGSLPKNCPKTIAKDEDGDEKVCKWQGVFDLCGEKRIVTVVAVEEG